MCSGFNKDVTKKQLDDIGYWTCPYCVMSSLQAPGCNLGVGSSPDVISKMDERLDELKNEIEDLKTVKQSFLDIGKEHKEAKQKWSDIVKGIPDGDGSFASNIAKQVVDHSARVTLERENRECNVIMFNAEESSAVEPAVRKQDDQKLFNTMCNHVLGNVIPVKNVLRVGKKNESNPNDDDAADQGDTVASPPKPRPLKVCFPSVFDKRKFLSSLSKLKDAPSNLKCISVQQDLSPDERLKSKALLAEAYNKNQTENPTNFLYKVRGPPHAMKIVKVYKR